MYNLLAHSHMELTRVQLGDSGEKRVMWELEKLGWIVDQYSKAGYDLKAINPETGEIVYIEVKTARRGKDNKWRATTIKKGHTDHRKSDVIVFICVDYAGIVTPFIIPTSEQGNKRQLVVTSAPKKYSGKLAKYRSNWSMFTD